MDACKLGAFYRRDDGLIILDPEKCNGCGDCMDACPYDAIYKNDELKICQKCTGCAHLLDNDYKLPRCVEACPTDAMLFGEESELQDFIVGATVRLPETGMYPKVYYRNIPGKFIAGTVYDPKVYYRNIPGKFIAGTVYDPIEKEVVIGARCRATNGGKTVEVLSDEYGDFWFKDLAMGKYDIVIEAKGYEFKTFDAVDAKVDVNLGDIPLDRK